MISLSSLNVGVPANVHSYNFHVHSYKVHVLEVDLGPERHVNVLH